MSNSVDPRTVTVGERAAQPSGTRTAAQIEADLERQRAELAATIDQLYARVQPATLAQEAKEEATVRFKSFKESASLTLQDAVGGNAEAIKKVAVVALSTVGAIGVLVLLATRKPRTPSGSPHRPRGRQADSRRAREGRRGRGRLTLPPFRVLPSPGHPARARGLPDRNPSH